MYHLRDCRTLGSAQSFIAFPTEKNFGVAHAFACCRQTAAIQLSAHSYRRRGQEPLPGESGWCLDTEVGNVGSEREIIDSIRCLDTRATRRSFDMWFLGVLIRDQLKHSTEECAPRRPWSSTEEHGTVETRNDVRHVGLSSTNKAILPREKHRLRLWFWLSVRCRVRAWFLARAP